MSILTPRQPASVPATEGATAQPPAASDVTEPPPAVLIDVTEDLSQDIGAVVTTERPQVWTRERIGRLTAVVRGVAIAVLVVVAPWSWAAVVVQLPLSEAAQGGALVVGWVAMVALAAPRHNDREHRP